MRVVHCRSSFLEEVFSRCDLIITDLKHMDPDEHKRLTGVGNNLVLKNIQQAATYQMPMIIRIPIVATYNNSEKNIVETAKFISNHLANSVKQVQLIPYRELGVEKYNALGMDYPMKDYTPSEREEWEKDILQIVELMKMYDIPAVAGTSNKLESLG